MTDKPTGLERKLLLRVEGGLVETARNLSGIGSKTIHSARAKGWIVEAATIYDEPGYKITDLVDEALAAK